MVVLVWALLGYRFWFEDGPRADKEIVARNSWVTHEQKVMRDTFHLSLPSRDPFLDKATGEDKRSPQEVKSQKRPQANPPIPHVIYKGSLEAEQRLGIVVWEGKTHRVWTNQSFHNAKIRQIEKQYIDLQIDGKSYRIGKGKSIGKG